MPTATKLAPYKVEQQMYRTRLKVRTYAETPKNPHQPKPTPIGMDNKRRCRAYRLSAFGNCLNQSTSDGYCDSHWQFLFKNMTNKQRFEEKRHLRNIIKQKELEGVQTG